MPVAINPLDVVAATTNVSSYTGTAGITPGANRLILVSLVWSKATTPDLPTSVVGYGITFTAITDVLFNTIAAPTVRVALYRGMAASPTNGQLTATFAVNQTGCVIGSDEFTGVDTSGTNGSGAVIQSATNRSDSIAAAGTLAATLAALAAGSGVFVVAGSSTNVAALSPESGFVQDRDNGYNTPATGFYTQYSGSASDLTTTDNTPGIIVDTATKAVAMIGVEIKAATVGAFPFKRTGRLYRPDGSWWAS